MENKLELIIEALNQKAAALRVEYEALEKSFDPIVGMNYFVELPKDPALEGLYLLNLTLNEIQKQRNNILVLYTQWEKARAKLKQLNDAWDELIERARNAYLTYDLKVSEFRNAALQAAYVNTQLDSFMNSKQEVVRSLADVLIEVNEGTRILANLEASNDACSRMVTVISLQVEIRELTPRELPLDRYGVKK